MRLFRGRQRELRFPEPAQLPSLTEHLRFRAHVDARFREGRAAHGDLDGLVRDEIRGIAAEYSRKWHVDDLSAAQDSINAQLGKSHNCPCDHYRDLVARIKLHVNSDTRQIAVQEREDRARIERLRYLRTALYADPTLLLIEFIERNPTWLEDAKVDISKFRQLANEMRESEKWWGPLMTAWSELATETKSSEAVAESMHVLLDAIRRLDTKLAARHELPIIQKESSCS